MTNDLPYFNLTELMMLFGYKSLPSIRKSIREGHLKVPTYKICGEIVADKEVVREFFLQQREKGLKHLRDGD